MAVKNNPEGWKFSEEVLPDGRTVLRFANGGRFTYPPLPGGDWAQRKGREMSRINYDIRRRLAREKSEA